MNTSPLQGIDQNKKSDSAQLQAKVFALHQAFMPIQNYQDFYRFYLSEHHDLSCRRLHFLGSSLGLLGLTMAVRQQQKRYVVYGLLAGYSCAWLGHFVFEKNKPASFKQPLYSFISDWRMFKHILTGQISMMDQKKDRFAH